MKNSKSVGYFFLENIRKNGEVEKVFLISKGEYRSASITAG